MTIQKGQVLNAIGRNARKPMTDAIMAILTRDVAETLEPSPSEKVTNAQAIALALIKKAREGDTVAMKEVIDRSDGKAVQQLDVRKVDPFDELSTDELIAIGAALGVRLASIASETEAGAVETEA